MESSQTSFFVLDDEDTLQDSNQDLSKSKYRAKVDNTIKGSDKESEKEVETSKSQTLVFDEWKGNFKKKMVEKEKKLDVSNLLTSIPVTPGKLFKKISFLERFSV